MLNANKSMFACPLGVSMSSLASFSVRKNFCHPPSNNMLGTACGCVDGEVGDGAVLSVVVVVLLAGLLRLSLQMLVWCLLPHLQQRFLEL